MRFDAMMSRRTLLRGMTGGVLAASAIGLLAACGGDDDDDDDTAADPTATESEGSTDEPTATEEAASDSTPAEAEDEATESTGEGTATEAQEEPTEEGDATEEPVGTEEPEGTEEAANLTGSLVIYSGRSEELVGPIIERFKEETGLDVQVQYAGTTELAATLLEEGENSPADVFFAQDAGALGAVAKEGMLAALPDEVLNLVDARFRSANSEWIGISGRARTVVHNREAVPVEDIPASILDFTAPEWEGRLGWAPTNASFQSFVTALMVLEGEDVAREWLEGIQANGAQTYQNNSSIVEATINGEIDAGFVNHYYLYRFEEEAGGEVAAANYWYTNGDPGALVNVAGVGVLASAENTDNAQALIEYFLSEEGQLYFADETFEYPLVTGVEADPRLVPLAEIQTPDIDLSDLDNLESTLELLTDVGLI